MDESSDNASRLVRYARMVAQAGPGIVVGFACLLLLQYAWDALFHPHMILEAFSVPKTLEEKGLTGQVVASRLIDHMKDMETLAERSDKGPTPQTQPPETPFKVQISGAGVSIDELGAYLRSLISHDTYLSGEIVETGAMLDFKIRKTVRENSTVICTLQTKSASWENDAAACLYGNLQPDRYARFLLNQAAYMGGQEESCPGVPDNQPTTKASTDRPDMTKVRTVAEQYFRRALTPTTGVHDLVWALEGLGYQRMQDASFLLDREKCEPAPDWRKDATPEQLRAVDDDAENNLQKSLARDPHFAVTVSHLAELEGNIGRDEEAYQYSQQLVSMMTTDPLVDGTPQKDTPSFQILLKLYEAEPLEARGDYTGGRVLRQDADKLAKQIGNTDLFWSPDSQGADFVVDSAFLHENACCAPDERLSVLALAGLERWSNILDKCTDATGLVPACPDPMDWPWIAKAYSQTGDQKNAMATINRSLDWTSPGTRTGSGWSADRAHSWCYLCWRVRAWIEANSNDWPDAIADMKHAITLAPDLPFAHAEFADIYRRERDLNAAEAEARRSVHLGSNYADALEIWGEILMDRGDYAAAGEKFTAAKKIAPQWSKLQQEWERAKKQAAAPH